MPDRRARVAEQVRERKAARRPLLGQELVCDVAVFFCGPGAMAKSLRKESRLQSKNGVRFSFRKEHF